MVRAQRAGRKTQTRRLVKPQPVGGGTVYYDELVVGRLVVRASDGCSAHWWKEQQCPYGEPGQLILGKETFTERDGGYVYKADGGRPPLRGWTPSIFMPRAACRIRLINTQVRVERLQEISAADCLAEGVDLTDGEDPREAYRQLWNSLNLSPAPIYGQLKDNRRPVLGWVSYPWSRADFEEKYPGVMAAGQFRGKRMEIYDNPLVWAITFTPAAAAVDLKVESCLSKE